MRTPFGNRQNPSDAHAGGWSDESIAYAAAGAVAGSLLLGLGVAFIARSRRPLSAPAGTPPPWSSGPDAPGEGTPLPPSSRLAYEAGQSIAFLRSVVLYQGEDDVNGATYPAQEALIVAPSAHHAGRWFVNLNNGESGWADLTS